MTTPKSAVAKSVERKARQRAVLDARIAAGSKLESKRGRTLDPAYKRHHCVSVRLNDTELEALDLQRRQARSEDNPAGRVYLRGEWLRMSWHDFTPSKIPQLNREAYLDLARSSANLNQIAHHLNSTSGRDVHLQIDRIRKELNAFREFMIGAHTRLEVSDES